MRMIKVLSISLLFTVFANSSKAFEPVQIERPSDVTQGSLLMKLANGRFAEMPLLDTEVNMQVTGLVARVEVVQQFVNTAAEFIEAEYVFPLPENSAVDAMKLQIGERLIVGEIKEKEEAKRIYHEAKRAGKRTALLEQNRPNLFKTRVANIAPDELIKVRIEYQQTVDFDNGVFSLRFPMAITPRYTPVNFEMDEQGNWTEQGSEESAAEPMLSEQQQLVEMNVELDTGLKVERIESLAHPIIKQAISEGKYRITLAETDVMDRDFLLEWSLAEGKDTQVAHYRQELDGADYHYLMVVPPAVKHLKQLPRSVTLVIDQSGSMEGESMEQAKLAVREALLKLTEDDYFNIVAFNHETRSLYTVPIAYDKRSLAQALDFVDDLSATGGTEMAPALSMALSEPADDGRVRQIIFITDGAVGNEAELFRILDANLGNARLFTVGIGSAPNSYFMRKAAEFGRGTFSYIRETTRVAERMGELFDKLSRPVMQDLLLDGLPDDVEAFPSQIHDLYHGEPMMLLLKTNKAIGPVALEGKAGRQPWRAKIKSGQNSESGAIAKLWARAKIESLSDEQLRDPYNEQLKQQMTETAINYHLVSKYTSLVAVDKTPARSAEQALKAKKVSNMLPKGSNGQAFNYPRTALGWQVQLYLGMTLMLLGLLIARRRVQRVEN